MEWIPKSRLKVISRTADLSLNSAHQLKRYGAPPTEGQTYEYCIPAQRIHCTEILKSTTHQFSTHILKLLVLHSSYRTQMLRYVGIYKCICAEVLLSTGAVRRVKSMSGSEKSQGGWLLPTELWDRKMRGRLYMRRWALEMNLELHFLIFHTHTKFSPFTKRRIEN